jgi:hypothetical protein
VGAPVGPEWREWLDDARIEARDDGTGLVTATVRDQAMLLGLLTRIRDLAIPLLGLYPGSERPQTD